MFTIIGGDGKEYGPVTAEQIKEWIAGGRANLDTHAKREGEDVFKALREFPEFAPTYVPAAGPSFTAPPPAMGTVDPKAYADAILANNFRLDIGLCFSRGWAVYKSNFWPILGITLLVMIVSSIAESLPIVGILAALLLNGVFLGGLQYYLLKNVRGERSEISDAFGGFQIAFVPLMLAGLISLLLTSVGMILLVIPGIYLAVGYLFAYLLVIDKRLDFWPALEVSRRVIHRQWFPMLGLLILGLLLGVAGFLAVVIGVFFVLPLLMLIQVVAYEQLVNGRRE